MGNGYQGTEKRAIVVFPCPLHDMFTKGIEKDLKAGEERMQRFEQKIDDLLKGQVEQALAIRTLQDAMQNGLRGEVKRTMECTENLSREFKDVCERYDVKMKEFDEFHWFRTWANSFKDGLIKKLLTIAFIGGTAIGLLWLLNHVGVLTVLGWK